MTFPEPVIFVAIEPRTKADQDKLAEALAALSDEDPTFHVRKDADTGQTIICGHGRAAPGDPRATGCSASSGSGCNVGRPQVAYRETITARSAARSSSSSAQPAARPSSPASCWTWRRCRSAPACASRATSPADSAAGRVRLAHAETGVRQACDTGVLAGYALVDLAVTAGRA